MKVMLRFLINSIVVAMLFFGCNKPTVISSKTKADFGMAARNFCEQVVPCQIEEMRLTLKDDIQRRSYIESRMTEAACTENQLRSIEVNLAIADELNRCTKVIKDSTDCKSRLTQLAQDEHCRKLLHLK